MILCKFLIGYGVRQFNVLDMKVGNFVSLCKEQVLVLFYHFFLSKTVLYNINRTQIKLGFCTQNQFETFLLKISGIQKKILLRFCMKNSINKHFKVKNSLHITHTTRIFNLR